MRKLLLLLIVLSALGMTVYADEHVTLSGFFQGQYVRDKGEGIDDQLFETQRARIILKAEMNEMTTATVSIDAGGGEVTLRDASVMLRLNEWVSLQVGQFKVPFSAQIIESSADRLTPERALINTRTFGNNPRDVGALLHIKLEQESETPWMLTVGGFNGSGPNTSDTNTDKDFFAALSKEFGNWGFHVSFVRGEELFGVTENRRDRWSVDAMYKGNNWGIEGQYAQGQGDFTGAVVTNTDVRGGYAQLWFRPEDANWTLFVRGQTYDPDDDTSDDEIDGWLFGFAYDFQENVRFLAAYERLNDQAVSGNRDLITVRLQVRY